MTRWLDKSRDSKFSLALLFLVFLIFTVLLLVVFVEKDAGGRHIQSTGFRSIGQASALFNTTSDGCDILFIAPYQPMGHFRQSSVYPDIIYGAVTVSVHDVEVATVPFLLDKGRNAFYTRSSGGGEFYKSSIHIEKGLNIFILYDDWHSSYLLIPVCKYLKYMPSNELNLDYIDDFIRKNLSAKEMAMYSHLVGTKRYFRIKK